MIVDSKPKPPLPPADSLTAGPSAAAVALRGAQPPPFQDAPPAFGPSDDQVYAPPGGEAPPPDFTPYDADYFEAADGTIVSHDRHLNEDGEALYRFLLSHAQTPPQLFLHIRGEHSEIRRRSVAYTDNEGHTKWREETEHAQVVDFDFSVDVSQHILPHPVQWSVPDDEPTYRGRTYLEVDSVLMRPGIRGRDVEGGYGQQTRRWKATRNERKTAQAWNKERKTRGLPPWIGPDSNWNAQTHLQVDLNNMHVMKSSQTVREWADEYCASDKPLKEFTYTKVIYGWNFDALEAAVVAAVKSTYYRGDLTVRFERRSDQVHIRAHNWLSRALSNKWLKFFFIITLVYPLIWLYKWLFAGGRWEVCGGAFALVSWQRTVPQEDPTGPPPPFASVDEGWHVQPGVERQNMKLVGLKEGEWFQRWEGTIKRAVSGRCKADTPFVHPDGPSTAALMLDGYRV